MKKPALPGVKTFGTGLEKMDVYGALPLSRERIQIGTQEAKRDAEVHEKEITAPIKSYSQGARTEFGATMGGIGISDQEFQRRTVQWEREQRSLFADRNSINTILPNANGTSAIQTFHN
jgi:hypothetical protein